MTPEEKRDYNTQYALTHKKEIAAKSRAWYLANKDKCAQSQKKYRKAHPDKIQAYARDHKLGRGAHDHFLAQLTIQKSLCAICEKTLVTGPDKQQDHDHVTNQFRGVLCAQCNVRLGWVESSWLPKALTYLKSWKENTDGAR